MILTPRTDQQEHHSSDAMNIMIVRSEFARQLERELTQSNQELERVRGELREAQDDCYAQYSGRKDAEAKVKELTAQVTVMIQHLRDWPKALKCQNDMCDWEVATEEYISNLPAGAEKLVRLVAVVDELLAWDKKYPKGQEWQYGLARTIEKELDAIVDKLRDLRGDK